MTEAEGAGGVRDLITQLRAEDYIADRGLATSLFLALRLGLGFPLTSLPLGQLVIEVRTPNTGPFLLEVVRHLAFDKFYLVVR